MSPEPVAVKEPADSKKKEERERLRKVQCHTADLAPRLFSTNTSMNSVVLEALRACPDLWERVLFFLADLLRASDDATILQRLSPHDEHYLPFLYFSEEERTFLLRLEISSGLELATFLDQRLATKSDSRMKLHMCTSHDLFPVFREVFKPRKGFHKDKSLVKKHKLFLKKALHS
jgi:hypothetical protein